MKRKVAVGSDPSKKTNVYLNVYDIVDKNKYLYWTGLGVFHTGISAHGVEYAFGGHYDHSESGVYEEVRPKEAPGFTFRREILMGTTSLDAGEFRRFIKECGAKEYHGNTYHLLTKNCNHFSDDMCRRLTGRGIPRWVNRLARFSFMCNCFLPDLNMPLESIHKIATHDHLVNLADLTTRGDL